MTGRGAGHLRTDAAAPGATGPRVAFYGNDLSGSADALAQLHRAGLLGLPLFGRRGPGAGYRRGRDVRPRRHPLRSRRDRHRPSRPLTVHRAHGRPAARSGTLPPTRSAAVVETRVRRVVVAGGDTAGRVVHLLGARSAVLRTLPASRAATCRPSCAAPLIDGGPPLVLNDVPACPVDPSDPVTGRRGAAAITSDASREPGT